MKKLFFIVFFTLSIKQSDALGLINNVRLIEKNQSGMVKIEKNNLDLYFNSLEKEADVKNYWEEFNHHITTFGSKCLALILNDFLKFYS